MKVKLKYKIIFFLLPFFLYMSDCDFSCKTNTTPDPPGPPPEPKYYTIQLKYVRPEIFRFDQVDKLVGVTIRGSCSSGPCRFGFSLINKINNYEFEWSDETQVIPDNENGVLYSMYGVDAARLNGSDDTAVVGDIFFLRVKETGFEIRLVNLMPCRTDICPYPGPSAKMVQWRLKRDGTITEK